MEIKMTEKTGAAFVKFLEFAGEKGLINKNTAAGYRAACQKVLEVDDDWENLDIAGLDVETLTQRFVHLKSDKYSPGSLETYKSRFRKAREIYLEWARDPSSWKQPRPRTSARRPRSKQDASSQPGGNRETSEAEEHGLITYPVPVREHTDAQLVVPRNLTRQEAKRLLTIVNALVNALVADDADSPES